MMLSSDWRLVVLQLTLGPVLEEVVFRGYLFALLAWSFQRFVTDLVLSWLVVITAALVFAVVHLAQPGVSWLQLACITSTGTLYGWIRQRSGSTAPAPMAHCIQPDALRGRRRDSASAHFDLMRRAFGNRSMTAFMLTNDIVSEMMEAAVPAFDPTTGALPPGDHQATLEEIAKRFGFTPQAMAVEGLRAAVRRFRQEVRMSSSTKLLQEKPDPGDIDGCG
jgi:hypothetical protein